MYRRLGGPVWTGAENLASHRDSIPGPSSRLSTATDNPFHLKTSYINEMFNISTVH